MSYNGVWYQNMFCHSKEVSSIKHILRWNLKIFNSPFWCDGIQTHNSHQWKTFSEKKSYQIIEKSKLPVNLQSPVQLTYMCLDFRWKPENTKERILLVCVHCFHLSWCQVWESTTFICSEAWQSMSNMSATIYCVPCSWYTWHFVFLLHILRMLFVFWVLNGVGTSPNRHKPASCQSGLFRAHQGMNRNERKDHTWSKNLFKCLSIFDSFFFYYY